MKISPSEIKIRTNFGEFVVMLTPTVHASLGATIKASIANFFFSRPLIVDCRDARELAELVIEISNSHLADNLRRVKAGIVNPT
jgi:hypothetical protein